MFARRASRAALVALSGLLLSAACATTSPTPTGPPPPPGPPQAMGQSPTAASTPGNAGGGGTAVAVALSPAKPPASGAVPAPGVTPAIKAILAAPDRTEDDRKLDAGRHAAEMLAFFDVSPGMRVAELGAGRGYTSELLARSVAPGGVVYAQNNRFFIEKFLAAPWTERMARPAMKNVVRVDREFDDPLPPEAKNLDLVVIVLLYHDTVWLKTDRDRMNRAVFEALRPGGRYIIIDHAARAGSGLADVQTLHRIDEAAVRAEVERAGFRLRREGAFLRNPSDTRDWNDSPSVAGDKRGTSDRFALEYQKP